MAFRVDSNPIVSRQAKATVWNATKTAHSRMLSTIFPGLNSSWLWIDTTKSDEHKTFRKSLQNISIVTKSRQAAKLWPHFFLFKTFIWSTVIILVLIHFLQKKIRNNWADTKSYFIVPLARRASSGQKRGFVMVFGQNVRLGRCEFVH